jgi:hypothetical protein
MTGLVAAASVGQAFTDLWHKIADIGPKWLVALAVLIIAWLLARLVRFLVQKAISKTSTQGHVDLLLARGAAGLVLLAGIVVALSEVGMSFSAALATLGLASVGIGFALQGVLSNLFAGIILLIQHPFTIGDQIRVGEQEGVVENIRVRDTQVLTYDGQRVFIPNKTVFDSPIVNYSSTTTLRVDIRVPLAEDADVGKGVGAEGARRLGGRARAAGAGRPARHGQRKQGARAPLLDGLGPQPRAETEVGDPRTVVEKTGVSRVRSGIPRAPREPSASWQARTSGPRGLALPTGRAPCRS